MKNNKKIIAVLILLMIVGFAAVATTLYINGYALISGNQDDFNVYYSNAIVNGKVDKSVITDARNIDFEVTFKTVGQKYTLDYDITNGSRNYDADVSIDCRDGNDYLDVNNSWVNPTRINSAETKTGTLIVEMIKGYTGEEELELSISCEINASPIERETLGDVVITNGITVEAYDKDGNNLNAVASEIIGEQKNNLLDSLVETGLIDDASDIAALIDVESDDFDDLADTTFDVSSIASEGEKIAILHYNEEKNEWELIGIEEVDEDGKISGDFDSYSPVAFVKVKDDGTYETIEQHSFANDSWATIKELVHSGNYPYQVGETKTVDMGTLGTHTVRVANTTPCTNGETSETACGFVVEFADIISLYYMNSSKANYGGWKNSDMRTYVKNTVFNDLPIDLQNVISDTIVVSGHGSNNRTTSGVPIIEGDDQNYTTTDKLYLLSMTEIVGTYSGDTATSDTKQLDIYLNNNARFTTSSVPIAKKPYNGEYNTSWWVRTPDSETNFSFRIIMYNGATGMFSGNANTEAGVSPAFRIV